MPNIVVMKPVSGYRRIYLRRIGSILPCCLPSGKVGGLQIQRSQGLSVDDYSFTLDALTLNFSDFCIAVVTLTDTYLDIRRWMDLVDKPESGAIWWNYFLP